ncbi:MAG: PfkB protein [Candidatus Magasanikbacteria bacterium]|nr:PfkB protein [Candidatus Magasanikbacteria bacterium]
MFDLVSIGDSTIDTLLSIDDAEVNCSIRKDRCLFCVNYADKIAVNSLHRSVAGNAANNAIGSSRLGMKTALYTIVGKDEAGDWIVSKLKQERVSTHYVHRDEHTNASTVINFHGERTILVYHAPRQYNLPNLDGVKWIYYSSVGKNHTRINKQLMAFLKKHPKVKLGYNPGTWQLKAGIDAMRPVLERTYIVFVNKEEAARIVGPQHDERHYLLELHKLGPKICVITDGPNGSYTFDGEHFLKMGILPTPVVERTGAGDSFATAFISALHFGKPIKTAMCWGTVNSASVIMKIGPIAGLLTRAGLDAMHKKYGCRHPVVF